MQTTKIFFDFDISRSSYAPIVEKTVNVFCNAYWYWLRLFYTHTWSHFFLRSGIKKISCLIFFVYITTGAVDKLISRLSRSDVYNSEARQKHLLIHTTSSQTGKLFAFL